ncbi:MAG TPA: hypothetical protein VH988_25005 [Thermoanaerobaculia bacterium]|jgi:hypothetical protein|nr:hypothetical protein [Thermoanaerobaculia bacterium]
MYKYIAPPGGTVREPSGGQYGQRGWKPPPAERSKPDPKLVAPDGPRVGPRYSIFPDHAPPVLPSSPPGAVQRTETVGFDAFGTGKEAMVTHGLGNCVALVAYDAKTKNAAFAHFDTARALVFDEKTGSLVPNEEKYALVKKNMETRLGEGAKAVFLISLGWAYKGKQAILAKVVKSLTNVFNPIQLAGPGPSASFDPLTGTLKSWDTEEAAGKATGTNPSNQKAPRWSGDRNQGTPIRYLEFPTIDAAERERRGRLCDVMFRKGEEYYATTKNEDRWSTLTTLLEEWYHGSPETPFQCMKEWKEEVAEANAY